MASGGSYVSAPGVPFNGAGSGSDVLATAATVAAGLTDLGVAVDGLDLVPEAWLAVPVGPTNKPALRRGGALILSDDPPYDDGGAHTWNTFAGPTDGHGVRWVHPQTQDQDVYLLTGPAPYDIAANLGIDLIVSSSRLDPVFTSGTQRYLAQQSVDETFGAVKDWAARITQQGQLAAEWNNGANNTVFFGGPGQFLTDDVVSVRVVMLDNGDGTASFFAFIQLDTGGAWLEVWPETADIDGTLTVFPATTNTISCTPNFTTRTDPFGPGFARQENFGPFQIRKPKIAAATYTSPDLTSTDFTIPGALTVTVDGGSPQTVVLSTAYADVAAEAADIAGQLTGVAVSNDVSTITFTSDSDVPPSSIQVVADTQAQSTGFIADTGHIRGVCDPVGDPGDLVFDLIFGNGVNVGPGGTFKSPDPDSGDVYTVGTSAKGVIYDPVEDGWVYAGGVAFHSFPDDRFPGGAFAGSFVVIARFTPRVQSSDGGDSVTGASVYVGKIVAIGAGPGWAVADVRQYGYGHVAVIEDSVSPTIVGNITGVIDGQPNDIIMVVDRDAQLLSVYSNGVLFGDPTDISGVGDVSNSQPVLADGGTVVATQDHVGWGFVFGSVWSAADVAAFRAGQGWV